PPNVNANKWLQFDMGVEVFAPEAGTVVEAADLVEGREYPAGTFLAEIEATGPLTFGWLSVTDVAPRRYRFELPNDGELVAFPARLGEQIPTGGRVAVVPKTG